MQLVTAVCAWSADLGASAVAKDFTTPIDEGLLI